MRQGGIELIARFAGVVEVQLHSTQHGMAARICDTSPRPERDSFPRTARPVVCSPRNRMSSKRNTYIAVVDDDESICRSFGRTSVLCARRLFRGRSQLLLLQPATRDARRRYTEL